MINDSYDLKMLNLCKLLKSPINEFALKISGIYLIFGLVLCIISNSILLLVFIRHKNLRTTPNLIIIAITLINLIGSIEFPFMIGNTFNSKWIWPDLICLITGFLHILIGSFQIYSITALSFLRFLVLRQANKSKFVSKKKIVQKAMLACFVLSMFWAICPLIGWSYYSVENHLLSCSIAHDENNLNIISYNFCFFLFAFLGPSCVTIYTNLKSIFIVMKLRKKEPSLKYLKLLRNDRRVTVNIIIYISGFLITRAPYASALTFNAYKTLDMSLIYIAYLSSLITLSSFFLSTLVYMLINKNIRSKLNIILFHGSSYIHKLLNQKEILNQVIIKSYLFPTAKKLQQSNDLA